MLLRFSVANWTSIRDEQELSLVAADEHDDLAVRDIPGTGLRTLPVVGVFGANASGKSNLLKAMAYAREAVQHSHNRWSPKGGTYRIPFLLGDAAGRPSEFGFDFIQGGVRYEYGFGVDDRQVTEEWLYSWPRGRRRMLFEREGPAAEDITLGPGLRKGFGRRSLTALESVRPNSLLVSAGALGNHPLLTEVYDWFARVRVEEDSNISGRLDFSTQMFTGPERHLCMLLLKYADLGIENVRVEERELPKEAMTHFNEALRLLNPDQPAGSTNVRVSPEILVGHSTLDGSGVELPYDAESSGTKTWLGMIGPVVEALTGGGVLVVDELDARLHPNLAGQLVRLFSEPETNPLGAQLVFNSHDVTLLSRNSFGFLTRDQTWFTQKGTDGATELIALREYKVRSDRDDLVKKYLLGSFGAVPLFEERIKSEIGNLVSASALACEGGEEPGKEEEPLSQAETGRRQE